MPRLTSARDRVMAQKMGPGIKLWLEKLCTKSRLTLTNGVKFDSSYDRNEPLAFQLGAGRVIKGYDEGVSKLRVGDQAILVIPGKLGCGPKGIPNVIPPDSTLIFIVEVVDVKPAGEGVGRR